MYSEIIVAVIGVIGLITVAIIENRARKDRKYRAQNDKEERENRLKTMMLYADMLYVNGQLSLITAKKLMGQKTNGEVEKALEAYKKIEDNYRRFEKEVVLKQYDKSN